MSEKKLNLNTISPKTGSFKDKKRLGRGLGSGSGKTSGRGHKGQKSRSGGFHKIGFEGGQMPLHRRLPKRGFTSPFGKFTRELRLSELNQLNLSDDVKVNISVLKKAGIINPLTRRVKVFHSGNISKVVHLEKIHVTPKAKTAIEAAGGSVSLPSPEENLKNKNVEDK
mgnify:CR=1 FL=1